MQDTIVDLDRLQVDMATAYGRHAALEDVLVRLRLRLSTTYASSIATSTIYRLVEEMRDSAKADLDMAAWELAGGIASVATVPLVESDVEES